MCISKEWVCDQLYDCAVTNKDEENCPGFKCPLNLPFKCDTSDQCYDENRRCNGHPNCPDKSNEKSCPVSDVKMRRTKGIKCVRKGQCIPLNKLCDKVNDCDDNPDEEPAGNTLKLSERFSLRTNAE